MKTWGEEKAWIVNTKHEEEEEGEMVYIMKNLEKRKKG